ncbi:hypothetical protein QOZ80_6BG0470650 [Eleusine coracana subsp. coracana]|nr:hypothetical protein QOZ80_6BG0470650 [Eleusine coracana subsp. coracana]
MRLSDFLAFAKDKDLSGIMITVENAAFMAEKLDFGVVDLVIKALDDSGYNKQTAKKVMIQSTNSSVLVKFKQETKYDLVYKIDENVRDAAPSSIANIKKFASAVSVGTESDATSQINAYVQGAKVDGVITDFPGTAHRYKLNSCSSMGKNTSTFMQPPQPGV